jgi:serine protease inhibitor
VPEDSLTFTCANASILNVDYLKSKVIFCWKDNFRFEIFLPYDDLAFEILQSRLGGYDLFKVDSDIETGKADFRGPVNLTLPNIEFEFSFELSRPLQSFGIIKMFNDGLPRKVFQEKLIANDIWQRASFNTNFLKRAFHSEENLAPTFNVFCNQSFFFSLRNTFSDVIHVFGLVREHEMFNRTET